MTGDKVKWNRVNQALDRSSYRAILKPYGFPEITNPFESAFVEGPVMPRWEDVPSEVAVRVAVTGGFYSSEHNPSQPISPESISQAAIEVADAGASSVHIHVRGDSGLNVIDASRFAAVIEPIRDRHPDLVVDGCLVALDEGDWKELLKVAEMGLLDAAPVNTTACYCGDTLFAKPPAVMIEKTRVLQEHGIRPEIAVYVDGDVDNAVRYLINSDVLSAPPAWIVLPALPGGSPMRSARGMVLGLVRLLDLIAEVDENPFVTVCAAGRASSYLAALAMLMGCHVRVGLEDTVWQWPHRDELLASNLQATQSAIDMAALLGRGAMDGAEFRRNLIPGDG